MSSREELESALVNADRAGDTQAAQQIANALKSGQYDGPPTNDSAVSLPEFQSIDGNNALFDSQFGDDATGFGQILRDSVAGLITLDGAARVDGIEKRFPELEIKRFDDGNNAIVTNPRTGGQAVVNAEGVTSQDIMPLVAGLIPIGKGAQAVNAVRNPALKAISAAATASAADGLYQGAETLQGGDQGFSVKRNAIAASFGGFFQGAAGKIANKLDQSATKRLVLEAAPDIENLKKSSSDAYSQIDDLGVSINQQSYADLVNKLSEVADSGNFRPKIHKKTAVALSEFTKEVGKTPTLGNIDGLRQVLGVCCTKF